ncbi:FtsX-like permease family protein [Spiroplasma endosymbiont of Stenodema calcarata]|uniref:ABC transporter permease n=1 Tax=Spiroplasma endosymbiont of Stenodema calcarata TaxID=3139328 RepID=UPI003CCB3EF0
MIRHLFKNFWLSFTKNSLQVLGLFLMLGVVITLFSGMIMSNNLSTNQLDIIGKNLYNTNISFQFSEQLKIALNNKNLSYGLNNINYINSDQTIDIPKVESSYFLLQKRSDDNYQIVLDSKDPRYEGKLLASNSSNPYFIEQLQSTGNVMLNFTSNILPNSDYFLSRADYDELDGYLKNQNDLIPFVSSPDNTLLVTKTKVFTSAYKNFANNQAHIYQLELRLLNSVIIGSVADRAIMSNTMQVYDIFKAENFYIQSDRPHYWTTPIMIKGSYQTFLNYNATADYPPIIMNNSYASHNKINIGDLFTIYGFQYRVVGFATNAYVNSTSSDSSFIYNPYLWIRGDEYDQLQHNMAAASRIMNSGIKINAAFAKSQWNKTFLTTKNSWSDMASVYDNANFTYLDRGYSPLNHMKELISNKEGIIWSILVAISLLLVISSFIMISMIVNKLLSINRNIIGNLKAQGYGTGTIAFLLLACFIVLMFVIASLSLVTSWLFSFILNITYQGFLEFTTYISVPPWWLIIGTYLLPSLVVCTYAFLFIIIEVSRPTLVLLKPKMVKVHIPKVHFWQLNFKYKISLKFALDAKWKLLLTIVVTTLTGAMLFTGLTTIINFSQINLNLKANTNWKYVYRYDTNYNYSADQTPPYDYLVYANPTVIKDPNVSGYLLLKPQQRIFTEEMVLKKYSNFGTSPPVCGPFIGDSSVIPSLKHLWFKANSYEWYLQNCKNTQYYDQITKFIQGSVYEYFINELSHEDGIITIGYQPIIYGPYQSEIFADSQSLYAQEAVNLNTLKQFLTDYKNANDKATIELSIPTFYRNFISGKNLKSLSGSAIEFYDYKNNTNLFYPNVENKTDISWFFNKITSFDKAGDGNSLLHAAQGNRFSPEVNSSILQVNEMKKLIQKDNWFHSKDPSWDPANYHVQLYPIIINKAYQFLQNINIGDILASNFNDKNVTFYVVADQFNNGMKNMFLINRYNNQRLTPKRLSIVYSSLTENETYRYIGVYEKNNNYNVLSDPSQYQPSPIYNGTKNLKILLDQTVNLQIILFLIYLLILIASIVACIFQIFIITNIILKDNLKVLNSFKALGYSDFWIFNLMFLIYLPIILISWVISIPIGSMVINLIRYQIVYNMLSYVSGTINIGDYLISFLGLLVMFVIAFALNKRFMNRRYPILKTINWI